MDVEERIHAELDGALAASAAPPLGSLVGDAITAGVRVRRRRRLLGGTGGVVALVVAGVLFAASTGRATVVGPAAAPTPTPSVAAGPKPATGKAVIALLVDLLPPGGTRTEVEGYTLADGAYGSFLFDDGQGASTVTASVASHPLITEGDLAGMNCPAAVPGFSCVHGVTPAGDPTRLTTMGPYTVDCNAGAKCGIQDVRLEIKRADGVYITIDTYNGPFGGGRAPTRAQSLLTPAQLLTIGTDPRWGLTMNASFVDNAESTIVAKTSAANPGFDPPPAK